jgi:hypothetical protein
MEEKRRQVDSRTPLGQIEESPSMEGGNIDAQEDGPRAESYPSRVPDGEYLAVCEKAFLERKSRAYGARYYLTFRLFDGEFNGLTIRMFLKPSKWPNSRYYIAWSIANGRPPSRNARLSQSIFTGKLFRIRTATVKPCQKITGPGKKMKSGPELPEPFWYSKVDAILSLEATNGTVQ